MNSFQNAIITKIREGQTKPREHLLDYSIDKYGEQLVNDIRALLRILVLYLPLPLFWSLFDQKGSRWIFQAEKMNGAIGFYVIKPDQMIMVNPLLVIILIPLFEGVFYSMLSKIGLRHPLQRITLGGILGAISFQFAAFVQFKIESSPENSVHVLWQLPQYFILSAGETIFATSGLAFSYEQAPNTMKTTLQGFWQFNNGIGNLITWIFVANFQIFNSQTYDFLLFSGLMFIDMFVFVILAKNYQSSVQSALPVI